MKVRGTSTSATLSSVTRDKHVAPTGEQEQKAVKGYADATFVTDASVITGAVDGNSHDFTEANGTKSARKDITASVTVYQFKKRTLGKGEAVDKVIDGEERTCEIGVVKTGDDRIQVTHFMLTT